MEQCVRHFTSLPVVKLYVSDIFALRSQPLPLPSGERATSKLLALLKQDFYLKDDARNWP